MVLDVPPHPSDGSLAAPLAAVQEATNRYLQTLDALGDGAYAAPSVLPGWSRAHVIAHVALNALALARAFESVERGEATAVYPSAAARDADIDEHARHSPAQLRELSLGAAGVFREITEELAPELLDRPVARVPGGPEFTVGEWIFARWREVEIHHADLDAGYEPEDWPADFVDHVFKVVVEDRADGPPMVLAAPEGTTPVGPGDGPTVRGSRARLAWWLLGRGQGHGLACEGTLPTLGPWHRRTPAR